MDRCGHPSPSRGRQKVDNFLQYGYPRPPTPLSNYEDQPQNFPPSVFTTQQQFLPERMQFETNGNQPRMQFNQHGSQSYTSIQQRGNQYRTPASHYSHTVKPNTVIGEEPSTYFSGVQNRDQVTHNYSVKSTKPPTYDGSSSFKDYLVQFEMVSRICNWNSELMALELASCLRGPAVAVLGDLEQHERLNFSTLVSALLARFEPENQTELYKAQLKSRVRKANESLPELAQDIRKLTRNAYPKLPMELRDAIAKDAFRDSLNNKDLELAIFQGQAVTLQDALKTAVEYEAFQSSRQRKLPISSIRECFSAPETLLLILHYKIE